MAFIQEIDRKCQTPDCTNTALVEVLSASFTMLGKYCRRHGNKELHKQMEKERNKPKALEAAG